MPRFLLDENIDVDVADLLRSEFGIEVDHVTLRGLSRRSDQEIAEFARAEGLVVIIRDHHFSDIWHQSVDTDLNVVHVRVKVQTMSGIVEALRQVFGGDSDAPEFRGTLMTVKIGSVRVKHRS